MGILELVQVVHGTDSVLCFLFPKHAVSFYSVLRESGILI